MSDEQRYSTIVPESFKRKAVERVRTSGLSIGSVAAEPELHETVLRKWVRAHSGLQAAAMRCLTQAPPPSPSDLASKNARLPRENERLRMDRNILKNAARIVGTASR